MASTPKISVLLDLPAGASRSALRAGLMASNLPPTDLPIDQHQRDTVLRGLADRDEAVVFIDISHTASSNRPGILELDALVPKGPIRRRVFLTRLEGGHISLADRHWVQSLGFSDIFPEFSTADSAGWLRQALEGIHTLFSLPTMAPAELARYLGALVGEAKAATPRDRLRHLTGLSAEALAQKLSGLLDIRDRSYRLKPYLQCFVGKEATAVIARTFDCSDSQAVSLGQDLGTLGLLVHVTHDHSFQNENLFFRLAVSDAVNRLNLGKIHVELIGKHGVAVADRSYLGKVYPDCWIGSEAVDWLVARYKLARHEAWIVLEHLAQFGLLEHVLQEHDIQDSEYYYRFTRPAAAGVANR